MNDLATPFAALAALLLLGSVVSAEDTEPVSREELRNFINTTWSAVDAANKGRRVSAGDREEIEQNIHDVIDDLLDEDGELDDEGEHFVDSGRRYRTRRSLTDHIEECPVCHDIHEDLLWNTSITPIELIRDRAATHCATPAGRCPMMVRIPVGSSCYCDWRLSGGGVVWGVAR